MSLRKKIFFLAIVLPATCCAQSVLENPNFDKDISGWTVSDGAQWADFENSPIAPSDLGGSLALMTYSQSTAEQCVAVPPEKRLFDAGAIESLDFDLNIVNQGFFSCAKDYQEIEIAFDTWQGDNCESPSSTRLGGIVYGFSGENDTHGWTHFRTSTYLAPGTDHLHVYLSAFCYGQEDDGTGGVTTVFFDKFWMRSERIFVDGFSPYDE